MQLEEVNTEKEEYWRERDKQVMPAFKLWWQTGRGPISPHEALQMQAFLIGSWLRLLKKAREIVEEDRFGNQLGDNMMNTLMGSKEH